MLLLPLLLTACDPADIKFPADDTGRPDADADTDTDADTDADTDTDAEHGPGLIGKFRASEADVVLYGEDRDDGTGANGLATAGDITGDGSADLLAAASNQSVAGGSYNGQAYVIATPAPGHASITTSRTLIDGVGDYGHFGYSLSTAGDVDGDGNDDVVVGAPGVSVSYIFHGPLAEGRLTADDASSTLRTAADTEFLGQFVAPGGDVDGDGRDDVLITALDGLGGAQESGAVYVNLSASSAGDALVGDDAVLVHGDDTHGRVGTPAATSDLDGDGSLDLVVTAFDSGAGIFYGPLSAGERTLDDADAWLAREAELDFTGVGLAAADFDADGYGDLAVGAPNAVNAGLVSGAVFLAFGGDRLSGDLSLTDGGRLDGGEGDYSGIRLVSPGDIDGDGVVDLLVAACYREDGADQGGGAWLVHGPLTTERRSLGGNDTNFIGDVAYGVMGTALGGLLDYDADGALDIAVGATNSSEPGHGAIYLFAGG